jgi:hypothetical protein
MTPDDIIKMAQKAKLLPIDIGPTVDTKYMRSKRESLQHFAALVAAAEREHMRYDGIHTCHDECQRPACVATRRAVERERKACATIAEFNQANHLEHLTAEQIRARGEK